MDTEPHKKPGGRPASTPEDRRKQFDVRLNDAERALVEDAARRARLPVRVWARQALVQAAEAAHGTA